MLAARIHNLTVDKLDPRQAAERFPGYRFRDDFTVVFEPEAGYLEVENCVAAHIAAAQRHGAVVQTDEAVVGWQSDGRRVTVRTDRGEYSAASLVITAGPWARQLLGKNAAGPARKPELSGEVAYRFRKPVFWFAAGSVYDVGHGNSTFFFETSAGQFYGFPRIDGQTIKLAEHTGGGAVVDPLTVDRALLPSDLPRVNDFVREFLPALDRHPVRHSVCMYTKTPDSHFCIDRHPEWATVVVGAGFSGHGFKFTTVLGESRWLIWPRPGRRNCRSDFCR